MARSSSNQPKVLLTYCKVCCNTYEVPKDHIFSGGEYAKYAAKCPICGQGRLLPYEDVEFLFGELEIYDSGC